MRPACGVRVVGEIAEKAPVCESWVGTATSVGGIERYAGASARVSSPKGCAPALRAAAAAAQASAVRIMLRATIRDSPCGDNFGQVPVRNGPLALEAALGNDRGDALLEFGAVLECDAKLLARLRARVEL